VVNVLDEFHVCVCFDECEIALLFRRYLCHFWFWRGRHLRVDFDRDLCVGDLVKVELLRLRRHEGLVVHQHVDVLDEELAKLEIEQFHELLQVLIACLQ